MRCFQSPMAVDENAHTRTAMYRLMTAKCKEKRKYVSITIMNCDARKMALRLPRKVIQVRHCTPCRQATPGRFQPAPGFNRWRDAALGQIKSATVETANRRNIFHH